MIPDDPRLCLRVALHTHLVHLDYDLAAGLYRQALKLDDEDPSTLYAYSLCTLTRAGRDSSQDLLEEGQELLRRAKLADRDRVSKQSQHSYEWFEMEFYVAALSDVWRPEQIMNKAQCPSLFSITSAEARGRILCNAQSYSSGSMRRMAKLRQRSGVL